MTSPESDFLDRLLETEPLNPQHQHRFEQAFRDLVDRRIKGIAWVYWAIFLAGSAASTLFFGRGMVLLTQPRPLEEARPMLFLRLGTLVCFLFSLLATGVVVFFMAKRRVNFRFQQFFGRLMPAGAFLLVVLSFMATADNPGQPGAAWFGIYALAAFTFTSSMSLWNRIVATDYHAQERMIRLEYRLTELTERLPPQAQKP